MVPAWSPACRWLRAQADTPLRRPARYCGRLILFDPENDAAADPVCLGEADQHLVADPEDLTRPPPDQSVGPCLVLIIVAGDGRYRHEPFGSTLQCDDE